MAKKKSDKNPYRGFTIEQIRIAEESSYFMVVGKETFVYNNQQTFSKEEMNFHYTKLVEFLKDVVEEGTEANKADAIKTLSSIMVLPLRIN